MGNKGADDSSKGGERVSQDYAGMRSGLQEGKDLLQAQGSVMPAAPAGSWGEDDICEEL